MSSTTDLQILSNLTNLVRQLPRRNQTLDEEQQECLSTCMPSCQNFSYPVLGLCEELAEFLEKFSSMVYFSHDFNRTPYADHLTRCLDNIINAGREIGRIAKKVRHGDLPEPFKLGQYDTVYSVLPALRFEIGDIRWMLNVADYYLTVTTPTLTAQLTSDLRHNKISHRHQQGTIDAQGDAIRTPISPNDTPTTTKP